MAIKSFFYPPSPAIVIPPGGATAANQVLEINELITVATNTTNIKVDTAYLSNIDASLSDIKTNTAPLLSILPVSGPLTDAELRAAAVPVSGTVTANAGTGTFAVSGPLTDTELRATAVPVSGPLTDTELRATAVPVSGTFYQATQPVSGPLTDTELRATAVPVSGTFYQATQPVSGPLTDTELRATPVPVSGTVTASNPSVSATGAAVPASATMVGGSDGTDLKALKVSATGVVSVDGSAVTQPVSGTFWQATQPVSGPLTDTELRATAVPVSGPLTDTELRATAVPVSGTFYQATQPVSGTITANIGTSGSLALDATLTGGTAQSKITDGTNVATVKAASTAAVATDTALVVAISPNNSLTISAAVASTASCTNVSGSASSVSLLASNGSRKGAVFYNDSSASLYLKFGTTASTTSFTVLIPGSGYYELPTTVVYTGAIDGIWSSATGAVRITEL